MSEAPCGRGPAGPRSPAPRPPASPAPRPSPAGCARLELRVPALLRELLACPWPGVPAQVGPRGDGLSGPGGAWSHRCGVGRVSLCRRGRCLCPPPRVRQDAGSGGGVVSPGGRRGQAASCCPRLLFPSPRTLWTWRGVRRGAPAPCSGDPAGLRPPPPNSQLEAARGMNQPLALSLIVACRVTKPPGPERAVPPAPIADP